MRPFAVIAPSRHNAIRLLFLGLLVMGLQALAGTGLVPARAAMDSGGRFVAEVCTSHGVFTPDPARLAEHVPADGAQHDCCQLCAGAGPLLAAQSALGVSPAPTFLVRVNSHAFAHLPLVVSLAPPPRGPPLRA